uniref:Ring finger protein 216 n=1 Tax=Xenopus tropicalis TaxID=8364 RepID=A0A803JGN0_XENTR
MESQDEMAGINPLCHRGKDWDTHRNDAPVTISDDSDEDLSFVLCKPAQDYEEDEDDDDDDDVVILEERQLNHRPDLIRPAAAWHSGNPSVSGSRRPLCRKSLHEQHSRSNGKAEFKEEIDRDIVDGTLLSNRVLDSEEDLYITPTKSVCDSSGPSINKETICHKSVGKHVEPVPGIVLPSVLKNSLSEHPFHQSSLQKGFTINCHAPVQKLVMNNDVQDDFLGPAFPRTHLVEDEIPGPLSPPMAHPSDAPEKENHTASDLPKRATGPTELNPGNLPDQGAAGLDYELISDLIKETEARFPDVKQEYVKELILSKQCYDLNVICNTLLEDPDYPKRDGLAVLNKSSRLLTSHADPKVTMVDYFNFSQLAPLDQRCLIQASDLLMADFKMLSSQDIKWALHELKGHYAITRKHEDFLLALQVNEEQYEQDGQMIECRCCYGSFAFEELTQCADGHLFCKECLIKYAQEAAFGSGQPKLICMEGTCPCEFPTSEVEKVLPENILQKYYERKAEEDISAACADQLVRCPSCSFPALLDKDVDRFSCPNPHCRKETCKKCQKLWKEHVNLTCEELAESDDVNYRTFIEEKMTAACVRKCHICATELIKAEGCNRLSCRCGAQICYLCRAPINGYDHFCQHPHSPGAPCRECTRCSLWTDPSQDDERLILEIQRDAENEQRSRKGEKAVKRIGPPIQKNPSKSSRIETVPRERPLNQPLIPQFPLMHPAFPLPPVQPMYNNFQLNLGAQHAPYVPPLANIRLNYNVHPIDMDLEPHLPMHFGPQPRREL